MLILLFIVAITCQQDDEMLIFTPSVQQEVFNKSDSRDLLFTDILESLVNSLEQLEQEDDASFLAIDSASPAMEMGSPFDFFSNIFSMIPFGAPSDNMVGEMVEIETVLVEGHEKRTVTRTQVKNGVKTVTQEVITTTTTSELLDKSDPNPQLSSEFQLIENIKSEAEELEPLDQINIDDYIQNVEEPIIDNQEITKDLGIQESDTKSNRIPLLAGGAVLILTILGLSYSCAQTRQKSKKQEMKFMID